MKISIVIPTYNRKDIVAELLASLLSDTTLPAHVTTEIIVADDRSKDGTADMVREAFPSVRLVQGPGKNAELNKRAAIEVSTGDYLVNLDDDCIPRHGWIANVVPALERGEKIVQCKIVFVDLGEEDLRDESRKNFYTGYRWDMMPVSILRGGYRPQYINACHEFGCFVAREVLAKAPLDDPNLRFDHLGEAASFFWRITQMGYKVFFEPSAVIDHIGADRGGCKDRDKKQSPKRDCNEYAIGMVHNFIILTRMVRPSKLPLVIAYYLAGGVYLSLRQRKNCFKFFLRGVKEGMGRKFTPMIPYQNLK